jgi:hypothetical protein
MFKHGWAGPPVASPGSAAGASASWRILAAEKEVQGRAEGAEGAEPEEGRRQRGSGQQVGGGQYSAL